MGTAELSCPSLEALAAKFSVVAVVTQPDRPRGRELKLLPPPVKVLAGRLGLPVLQPARARDEKFIAELRALNPDLIVVVAYGQILPRAILDMPRYRCLNVHASLLPQYRGQGVGVRFFEEREAAARRHGYPVTTFCSVVRPADHPARPKDYVPLDEFWKHRGYEKRPDLVSTFDWKDIGERHESEKPMVYWMKTL